MLTIAGYDIAENLYESDSSLVYRACRHSDNQFVILKLIREAYPSPERIAWFRREYELTRMLSVPGVVKAYHLVNTSTGKLTHPSWVMVLEDFGGESLMKLNLAGRLPLTSFLELAIQITDILGQIHQRHVIHKDINPSNIVFNLLSQQIKIIDFGISTMLSRENPVFSNPGMVEGTLAYMSPEQTGRMNRTIDYRTDFYSLGATLYELLTGRVPFESQDILELVHSHIARQPVAPHDINPNIPQEVSHIVLKLMAKNAEDRYQSSYGLKQDLDMCLQQAKREPRPGHASDAPPSALRRLFPSNGFQPGQHDRSDRFQIPQKLYGREWEIDTLMAAFERTCRGSSEMMLVTGPAGIGKSVLVQELYKPITRQRGYFLSGKFDQFQRDIPYSAIIQAFCSLVQHLLTEDEAHIARWRETLLDACGPNGQVIIDVIPEVELIIGSQPAVPLLGPSESHNRFNLVFRRFIRACTSPEHPLVVFLDDLQWSDVASLNLIEMLLTAPDARFMFFIGAYRHNEVDTNHPLNLMLKGITQADATVNNLLLEPLESDDVAQLVAQTLNCTEELARPLARLIRKKTDGNPFFINEFLKSLYIDGLIVFDHHRGAWNWDMKHIQAQDITDNVVELMANKAQRLPEQTRTALKFAACIGNQFDLVTLSLVLGESINKTASVLESAMMEGLITPLGASYKVMMFDVPGLEDQVNASYKFAHDRIQQALYSLISADDQSSIHWRIGQLLVCRVLMQDDGQSSEYVPDGSSYSRAVASLPRLDEGQRGNLVRMLGDLFFDVVNHLNLGRQFIVQRDELYEVGSLNLVAGKKARQSAAYGPAYRYVQTAIELLMHHPVADGNPWEHHYDLMLALHVEAASAAYLSGLFVDMEQLIVVVQQQAHSLLDKVAVYEIEFQAHIARNRLVEAIHTGLHVLALLGCSLPEKPDHATIGATLAETRALVQHYTIDDIIVLPPMEDAVGCASMRVLSSLTTPAYQAMPQLLPLVVCNMVTLSLTRGNTSESIFAYAMYGLMLCGVVEDLDTGYHFGQLALKLLERSDARDSTARTLHVVECNVMHWKEHVLSTLRPLQEAYRSGLETGDFGFAALACMCYSYHSYFAGQELTLLAREMDAYRDSLQQMRQDTVLHFHQIYHQAVLNMLGRSKHPCLLQGEAYDEEKMLPLHIAANQRTALFVLYLNKLVLCYLAREYVWALECSAMAEEYMDGAVGLLLIPVFYLHDSLSRLARCAEVDQAERQSLLERVGLNQEKMQRWARHSPANHLHKFYLVEAERARVLVRDGDAREWYDKAIALARENQYLNEEALAYELAGMFYLAKGQPRVAHIYLYDAHYAYRCWGAAIRVQDLEQRYPQVFQHTTLLPSEGGAINSNTTLFETSQESTMVLDLNSLMKAVQAISSEIVLSKLLSKMMHIVLENAAAERGLLLLEWHGQWSIEVEGTIDGVVETVLHAIPLDAPHAPQLPLHLINYVIRTQQNVVINDAAASEGQFAQDMYIRTYQPRSILCAPLIHQGKMTGVLYLENYLSSGAFTPDRVQVLNVLSSHAAISIENARLYAELQTNEKKYRTLFEESKDVIFISTLDGYLIDFNPVTSLYSGYSEEELRRVPVRNFYANPDKMRQFREMMAQYGSVRDFEIQLRAKDGTLKDALITATQHYAEDGTLIGYQGIIRDMTEHKRAEQEKLRLIAIERELTLARDIQRNLLPPARPAWAGLDVVCYSAPVHAVGGDFYAYYTFDPTSSEPIKRYAIAVGDVAGNGMPAALLMAFSLASFHSTVRQRVAPDEFLAHMDNAIAEYTHATNQHCALVYMDITVPSVRVLPRGEHSLPGAVVPPGAGGTLPVPGHRHDSSVVGTVRFANAGCVLPIVKRASGMVRWVDVIGVPLGVGMGTRFDYKMATLELSSGDMIILSSDGVIEATGPDRELFGFDRLEHAIREGPDTSASAMLGHLRAAIGAFVGEQESHDDMTLVVIQV